jgi:hypothetical protein
MTRAVMQYPVSPITLWTAAISSAGRSAIAVDHSALQTSSPVVPYAVQSRSFDGCWRLGLPDEALAKAGEAL